MSRPQQVARPIVRSLRQAAGSTALCPSRAMALRPFSSTTSRSDETTTTTTTTTTTPPAPAGPAADPAVPPPKKPSSFQSMIKQGTEEELSQLLSHTLGSRRRRAALATTGDVPFEQMPYQCFQEARKLLARDRDLKVAHILTQTAKIKRIEATDASAFRGGQAFKQRQLDSLRRHVERLKILADINDPMVKRRFEDGLGDMNKPIYRYLAHRKWCAMERKIILQRVEQFHIVPDLLPKFEPIMEVKMTFHAYRTPHGSILNSRITEEPPTLHMQVFDKGERLFTVVVMDSDVPDAESDSFKKRLHFMATNIPWNPVRTTLNLGRLGNDPAADGAEPGVLAVPWLPAFAQKGAPYHRMSIFVLQHTDNLPLDPAKLAERYDAKGREGFSLKSFRDKFPVIPVGFTLFRSEWDDNTADVMARHGLEGADIEFKHRRVHSLKPHRKARGWEAKRQGPKFRHLWKYTKRIKGLKY